MNPKVKFVPVGVTLAATVGVALLSPSVASGQDALQAPAPTPAEVERVIVTGSLIPTAEEVGSNPVFSINRDLINKSGAGTTTEQLLQRQPIMNAGNIPVNNNGTSQSGPSGTAALALRGFDPGATLVLVNGRRVAPFPGVANSGYAYVDLTTIPITAVQSIDILKDGASTTYGSDAVAGVVNFNLYKDYRGAQVTTYYGDTLDKDAADYSGDILFGTGTDNTSITGDIFYYKHHSMFNHDRGNSIVPPFLSSNSSPYNLQVTVDAALHPFDVNGNAQAPAPTPPPVSGLTNEYITPPDFTNGLARADQYVIGPTTFHPSSGAYTIGRPRAFGGVLPGFNFNATSSSYPDQERWGGYAAFEHKICDDQLRIFGDFFYVDAKTHDELAPEATGDFEAPGGQSLYIPPNHPLPDPEHPLFGGPTASEVGMPAGAFNPFNPFEQIISGGTRARIADFGNRLIDNENIAQRFTAGVKGDKLFNGTWGYDGAFMYSQVQQIARFQGVDPIRFNRIVNGADSLFNPASGDYIGQTTPYNPFNDFRVPIASNQPLIQFATLKTKDILTEKLMTLDLNIYTTDLFDLPAGGVGLAFGGVFQRETFIVNPDDENRIEAQETPEHRGRKSWAIHAETLLPVFSPKWNIPGFYSLEFSAGVRYEAWENNDTNAAVPKVGVRWQPFDESFTLRSTWGEGFLEPSMTQLYGPKRGLLAPAHFTGYAPVDLFGPPTPGNLQDVVDPETGVTQLPRKDLGPEHDRTWTGGFVYTPKWIPQNLGRVTLTVDLWDVERSGVSMFLSPNLITQIYNAHNLPGQSLFYATVSPQQPPSDRPTVLFDPQGNYAGVSSPYESGGRMRANGVDLGGQYEIDTDYGTFSLLSRWSYLNEMVVNFPDEKPRQVAGSSSAEWYVGSFFGDVTNPQAWLKWRGDTTLDWTWHNWDLNWTLHMLDGYWEQLYAVQFDGFWKRHWVHPTWFNDAQLSYTFTFTPIEAAPVPGYSKDSKEAASKEKQVSPVPSVMPCWKNFLNNTTFTLGVNNIFGEDPPKAYSFELGNSIGYPGSLYDNLGRFVYGRIIKKF
jgi:iron complex outermembrane receptor protein